MGCRTMELLPSVPPKTRPQPPRTSFNRGKYLHYLEIKFLFRRYSAETTVYHSRPSAIRLGIQPSRPQRMAFYNLHPPPPHRRNLPLRILHPPNPLHNPSNASPLHPPYPLPPHYPPHLPIHGRHLLHQLPWCLRPRRPSSDVQCNDRDRVPRCPHTDDGSDTPTVHARGVDIREIGE